MTNKMKNWGTEPLVLPMEEEFAQAYMSNGFIGRKAALTAGYSESDLDKTVQRLIGRPRVTKRIAFLVGLKLRQHDLTLDDFVRKIKEHMDFNITDIYDKDGKLIPLPKLPAHVARCLMGVEVSPDGQVLKYRTESAMGYTKMLGQYLTVIQEALNRTDAMELQRKWSDEAEVMYNQIRRDAEALDAKRSHEHLPMANEKNEA